MFYDGLRSASALDITNVACWPRRQVAQTDQHSQAPSTVYGPRFLVLVSCFLVLDSWFLVLGPWSSVLGPWWTSPHFWARGEQLKRVGDELGAGICNSIGLSAGYRCRFTIHDSYCLSILTRSVPVPSNSPSRDESFLSQSSGLYFPIAHTKLLLRTIRHPLDRTITKLTFKPGNDLASMLLLSWL